MADKEKKGEDGNTNIWICRERKELFRWNKKQFSWLFKGYHLVKKRKIADSSLRNEAKSQRAEKLLYGIWPFFFYGMEFLGLCNVSKY